MEETQETCVTHQNGQNSHLKYHLQLKTKEDVEGVESGLGLQRRERQPTWKWKSKRLVNVCWPCRDNGKQRGILTNKLC